MDTKSSNIASSRFPLPRIASGRCGAAHAGGRGWGWWYHSARAGKRPTTVASLLRTSSQSSLAALQYQLRKTAQKRVRVLEVGRERRQHHNLFTEGGRKTGMRGPDEGGERGTCDTTAATSETPEKSAALHAWTSVFEPTVTCSRSSLTESRMNRGQSFVVPNTSIGALPLAWSTLCQRCRERHTRCRGHRGRGEGVGRVGVGTRFARWT